MTGRVVVLRSEPGASATARLAAEMGLEAAVAPMSAARGVPWQAPERASYDAVLLGSANAVRLGGAMLDACRGAPALVVGEATAQAARDAGMNVVMVGEGGLQGVLDAANAWPRLLRLAGEDNVALAPPTGAVVDTRIVYAVDYLPLAGVAVDAVWGGAVVLLHSALAAAHFAAECDRLGITRNAVTLAAIGPRVVAAAGTGWRAIAAAASPNDRALLELARNLCQRD